MQTDFASTSLYERLGGKITVDEALVLFHRQIKYASDIAEQKMRSTNIQRKMDAVIEFAPDGTIQHANENFFRVVGNTLTISKADFDSSTSTISDTMGDSGYIKGIVKTNSKLIILIDIFEVIGQEVITMFRKISAA